MRFDSLSRAQLVSSPPSETERSLSTEDSFDCEDRQASLTAPPLLFTSQRQRSGQTKKGDFFDTGGSSSGGGGVGRGGRQNTTKKKKSNKKKLTVARGKVSLKVPGYLGQQSDDLSKLVHHLPIKHLQQAAK